MTLTRTSSFFRSGLVVFAEYTLPPFAPLKTVNDGILNFFRSCDVVDLVDCSVNARELHFQSHPQRVNSHSPSLLLVLLHDMG